MSRFAIAAALALAATLPAVSAQAQVPRTFVSAAGSDSNPCSFALPCRHFQAAVDATSAGGEVDALDPAGYSPITISRGITIEGQGWSYIAPPPNGAAITINAVSDKVTIHGVSLNGAGITGGTNGIVFNSGASLNVRDSVIRNFAGSTNTGIGILFQSSSTSSQLFVSNTVISGNDYQGIAILPGGSSMSGVLNRVEMANNGSDGLFVQTVSAAINLTVSDCVSENNAGAGIDVSTFDGKLINVMVRNSISANNALYGLDSQSTGATIRVTRSTITGNTQSGWVDVGGGVVLSYGDNNIDGNGSGNTEPTPVQPYH